jgi:methylated-DNA-[protein]-cysteine S-methyltransferase
MSTGFAFFDTAIGRCAVTWGERGILGVQLPEADDSKTRDRLLKKNPGARDMPPPPDVRRWLPCLRVNLTTLPTSRSI